MSGERRLASTTNNDSEHSAAQDTASVGGDRSRARNVIFIQGDGMGIAHRELVRLATKGQNGELAMNQTDYTGFVHTDSADPDEAVTDSAAAYSTGVRTYNGAIGVDVNKNPVPTLLEQARKAGKSTGLVTTSQVTDAMPAAFGAQVPDRSDQSEIARQIIENSKVDVVFRGGEDFWYPAGKAGGWEDNPLKAPPSRARAPRATLWNGHSSWATSVDGESRCGLGRCRRDGAPVRGQDAEDFGAGGR